MRKDKNNNYYEYSDIELYDMIRSGAISRYPNDFWNGFDNEKTAIEISKHLIEDVLKMSIEDVKKCRLTELFYNNRLSSMIKNVFDGSVLTAIQKIYPELTEWAEVQRRDGSSNDSDKGTNSLIKYDDDELIEFLQNKANELGRNPFMREMKSPDGSVFVTRFGSYTKALIAAELLPNIFEGVDISEEAKNKVKGTLKHFVIENERLLDKEQIFSLISEGELKEYFKSYNGLFDYLSNNYTKDELIFILKNKKKQLGRTPITKDIKFPKPIVFIDAFGSWENATKEANV
jgi:hypothetical protein